MLHRMKRFARLGVVGAAGLLVACVSGTGSPPQASRPPPLPEFSNGDAYSFSDGKTIRFVASTDHDVRWRSDDGVEFVTSRDVLLPPIAWTSRAEQGQRLFSSDRETLFPLEPGRSAAFTATKTTLERPSGLRHETTEFWRCEVGNRTSTATPAGSFDTFRIACAMTDSGGLSLHRTTDYAPALGFYVADSLRPDGRGSPVESRLTGYRTGFPVLSREAQDQRYTATEDALEHDVSGWARAWSTHDQDAEGTIAPLATVRSTEYGWCRDYQEAVVAGARKYQLVGIACRPEDGRWLVLDMSPFTEPAG
jgi:surface antigen